MANASGTVIQSNQYYPFKMMFAEENITAEQGKQPYKYNGKELDQTHELNQYEYSARYYDPGYGRFTTVDPLAEKFFSWSPYVYCYNNPLRFIDLDGRSPTSGNGSVSNRLLKFTIHNPIIAQKIGNPTEYIWDSTISTNSIRLSTRTGLLESNGSFGSQVNAVRHALWQAKITVDFGTEIAKLAGDAHERNPSAAAAKKFNTVFNNMNEADETVDLLNNIIGREVGKENQGADMKSLTQKVLEIFKDEGLWTVTSKTDKNGNTTFNISRTKLTEEQYNKAMSNINDLNDKGRTKKEEDLVNKIGRK